MKRLTNTVATLVLAMAIFTSCQENTANELAGTEPTTELDLTSEEISSAIETMAINYSINVIGDDNGAIEISNDEELAAYGKHHKTPRIEFPIEITVDGETIIVTDKKELKALIGNKKRGHKPPPFKLVFPVTVTTDAGDVEIADHEAFKTYRESLEKGTHPAFVFPISVTINEETIVINSEEELKALMPKKEPRGQSDKPARPELVFPLSVNSDAGVVEIADKDAFKAYIETLEKGTHPDFVFPISVIVNEETIVINSEEDLKALMPKKEPRGQSDKPTRPEFVFPLSVNSDAGVVEIADKDAFKAYIETLEKGTHPAFVFPISVIVNEETVVVNSEEDLKALMPKKGRK
ncbi:hypothetical protein ACFLSU_03730 [Bacteroidota bacterium]